VYDELMPEQLLGVGPQNRVSGEATLDEVAEGSRIPPVLEQPWLRFPCEKVENLGETLGVGEGMRAGGELVHHDTKAPDVGWKVVAVVVDAACRFLWSDVRLRPDTSRSVPPSRPSTS